MYSGNTISLKTILWKVFNRPITEGLNYEDAAEYAIEGLRLIGAPLMYIDTVTRPPLEIVNYKAALPSCIINLRGVKLLNGDGISDIAVRRATDIYHGSIPCNDSGIGSASNSSNPDIITETTTRVVNDSMYITKESSTVNMPITTGNNGNNKYQEYTYTAQGGVIQTSFKEGSIEVAYKTLARDEEGYPLIPDNQKVKLALEYYILYRFMEPLWEMGKIVDKVFQRIEQQKLWYVGASNTDMQLQSGDHLESVMNAVNRLIINDKAFDNFYKGTGSKEKIKKYH